MSSIQLTNSSTVSTREIDSSIVNQKYSKYIGGAAAVTAFAVLGKYAAFAGLACVISGPACPIVLSALVLIAAISYACHRYNNIPQVMHRERNQCMNPNEDSFDLAKSNLKQIDHIRQVEKSAPHQFSDSNKTGISLTAHIDSVYSKKSQKWPKLENALKQFVSDQLSKKNLTEAEIHDAIKTFFLTLPAETFSQDMSLSVAFTIDNQCYTANVGNAKILLEDSAGNITMGSREDVEDRELRIAGPFNEPTKVHTMRNKEYTWTEYQNNYDRAVKNKHSLGAIDCE
jgi:hypothetical protein